VMDPLEVAGDVLDLPALVDAYARAGFPAAGTDFLLLGEVVLMPGDGKVREIRDAPSAAEPVLGALVVRCSDAARVGRICWRWLSVGLSVRKDGGIDGPRLELLREFQKHLRDVARRRETVGARAIEEFFEPKDLGDHRGDVQLTLGELRITLGQLRLKRADRRTARTASRTAPSALRRHPEACACSGRP